MEQSWSQALAAPRLSADFRISLLSTNSQSTQPLSRAAFTALAFSASACALGFVLSTRKALRQAYKTAAVATAEEKYVRAVHKRDTANLQQQNAALKNQTEQNQAAHQQEAAKAQQELAKLHDEIAKVRASHESEKAQLQEAIEELRCRASHAVYAKDALEAALLKHVPGGAELIAALSPNGLLARCDMADAWWHYGLLQKLSKPQLRAFMLLCKGTAGMVRERFRMHVNFLVDAELVANMRAWHCEDLRSAKSRLSVLSRHPVVESVTFFIDGHLGSSEWTQALMLAIERAGRHEGVRYVGIIAWASHRLQHWGSHRQPKNLPSNLPDCISEKFPNAEVIFVGGQVDVLVLTTKASTSLPNVHTIMMAPTLNTAHTASPIPTPPPSQPPTTQGSQLAAGMQAALHPGQATSRSNAWQPPPSYVECMQQHSQHANTQSNITPRNLCFKWVQLAKDLPTDMPIAVVNIDMDAQPATDPWDVHSTSTNRPASETLRMEYKSEHRGRLMVGTQQPSSAVHASSSSSRNARGNTNSGTAGTYSNINGSASSSSLTLWQQQQLAAMGKLASLPTTLVSLELAMVDGVIWDEGIVKLAGLTTLKVQQFKIDGGMSAPMCTAPHPGITKLSIQSISKDVASWAAAVSLLSCLPALTELILGDLGGDIKLPRPDGSVAISSRSHGTANTAAGNSTNTAHQVANARADQSANPAQLRSLVAAMVEGLARQVARVRQLTVGTIVMHSSDLALPNLLDTKILSQAQGVEIKGEPGVPNQSAVHTNDEHLLWIATNMRSASRVTVHGFQGTNTGLLYLSRLPNLHALELAGNKGTVTSRGLVSLFELAQKLSYLQLGGRLHELAEVKDWPEIQQLGRWTLIAGLPWL